MVDSDIVPSKVTSLMRCVARVEAFRPKDAATLAGDLTAQDVIALNLQRAVQLCVDLSVHVIADRGWPAPNDMADSFVRLHEKGMISQPVADALKAATGFRNVAVRQYQELDWGIDLDDFRRFVVELKDQGIFPL